VKERFSAFSRRCALATGHPYAFALALGTVVVWALSGPAFGFSAVWQLVINTGTTVVTFLLVFLIQHAQNRDTAALHVKLDEVLRALEPARTELAGAEDWAEEDLEEVRQTIIEEGAGGR
jgi:low affinity Fe/Cu permease